MLDYKTMHCPRCEGTPGDVHCLRCNGRGYWSVRRGVDFDRAARIMPTKASTYAPSVYVGRDTFDDLHIACIADGTGFWKPEPMLRALLARATDEERASLLACFDEAATDE